MRSPRINAYWRLMRLHQTTGIWLLLWPCWWSLVMASFSLLPPARFLVLFGIGAIVMRSAGCIVNDIVDREFDRQVERTKMRPLASGELSLMQALVLLILLLCAALYIALQFNWSVLFYAAGSLILVVLYPFMKRITWWPQAFLGLTFNWGTLLGWVALRGNIGWPAVALYVGGFFWTLGYDTIYGHQDKKDDIAAGVKSTALRLNQHSKLWIGGFYTLAIMAWGEAGYLAQEQTLFFAGLIVVALHFIWQVKAVDLDSPTSCMNLFRSNRILGWLMLGALIAGKVYF